MKRNDNRARQHPSYWAFAVHRISGILLALFIPLHFWVLSLALKGEAALNGFLVFTDTPVFRFGEWVLVILLSLHLMGGVRLLLIAFRPASPPALLKGWIAGAVGVAAVAGLAFILSLTT
ncbi:MAG TPA: succinate dehydrogenase, cytochrome b556 subunit [Burkholderiaceae bacterium]|nr:succinate dehydrogenase, cytochrome b556 subunit [Burkholderiaceae bacterium]